MKAKATDQRHASPPDIARVDYDRNEGTYNTVLEIDGMQVTFAALNTDHAQQLADAMNACSWVQAHARTVER